MKALVRVSSDVVRSARVMQMEGMFDVPPSERTDLCWDVDLPLHERDWTIGLVVGPSGSGKTTVARALWPEEWGRVYTWNPQRSILDSFPQGMAIRSIIELINSVGFSSPPAWVRPFHVLSTGEQFRVSVARALAEALITGPTPKAGLVVLDEFTSVVDRTVAQIGCAAIARTLRRGDRSDAAAFPQLVAVTCHYDVEEWLQPDWVYSPVTNHFAWRSLGTRPKSSWRSDGSIILHGSYSSTIII